MRIAYLSSHAELGGSEKVMLDLITELEHPASEVVVLRDGPLITQLEATGAPVRRMNTGPGPVAILRSASKLRRLLARSDAEVVHANGVKAALVAVLARPRQPIVWWKHDHSWDGRLTAFIADRCAETVGVSSSVLAGIPDPAPSSVIHPGIDPPAPVTQERRAAVREELGLGDKSTVALIGRIHPAKGHRELLAIAERLAAASIEIIMVGPEDPDQTDHATAVREEAAAQPNVRLLGHRDDITDVIAACEVIAIPSIPDERGMGREGFGLVAVEAMAMGVPVVAYSGGALPEVLGGCGLLVPAGDRDALATGIERLVHDRAAGSCGPDRVRDHFTRNRMLQEASDLYVRISGST